MHSNLTIAALDDRTNYNKLICLIIISIGIFFQIIYEVTLM